MDIIFWWDSTAKDKSENGIALSGKYEVEFNLTDRKIIIRRNKDFVRNFWGENIKDCFAVVGENGAGKTLLVNDIMYTIRDAKILGGSQTDFFMIYEDETENSERLYCVCTDKFSDFDIDHKEDIRCSFVENANEFMQNYEVAYFHNSLNVNDYLAQGRCKYDFSMGNQIYKQRCTTYEMNYDDLSKDSVVNFFEKENFRIICFLYDYALHNNLNVKFPFPQFIEVSVRIYLVQNKMRYSLRNNV